MEHFNLVQVLLVAVVTFIAAIDNFSFLESLYQPIVLGPVIGAILGDMKLGLAVGGSYQLMSIGSMPIGGAQPPNVVIGGVMATVFAVSIGATSDNVNRVLGLAVPFALLGQYAVTITFTLSSGLMSRADKAAKDANPKAIERLNYLTMAILGTLFAIIAVIGLVAGSAAGEALTQLTQKVSWLMAGLAAAGGMMRYVGFAVLMKIMLSNDLWGYFLSGFALATLLSYAGLAGPALILVAFIGLAIALADYQSNVRIKDLGLSSNGGGFEDGI